MERGLEADMVQIKEEVMKIRVDVDDTKHHVGVLRKGIKSIKQGKNDSKLFLYHNTKGR